MPRWKELKRFLERNGEHVRSGKHEIYRYQGARFEYHIAVEKSALTYGGAY